MSTITNRITSILRNEMQVEQFQQPELMADFAKISIEDLDMMAENIATLRAYVIEMREQQQQETRKKLEDFISANKDLGISSIEDLLQQLAGEAGNSKDHSKKSKAKSKTTDNNSRFEVTFFNPQTEKHESFLVVNKILSKKITEHPVYLTVTKKDKSLLDVDNFLRAYSPEFADKYPINAKWKNKEFHINDLGKLNKQSQEFFDEFKKTNAEATAEDFRTVVKEAYKKP